MIEFEEILKQKFTEDEIDEVYEELDTGIGYSKIRSRILYKIPYFSNLMEGFNKHCKIDDIAKLNDIKKLKNIKKNNAILTGVSYIPLFSYIGLSFLSNDLRYIYGCTALTPLMVYMNWRGETRYKYANIKLKLLERKNSLE